MAEPSGPRRFWTEVHLNPVADGFALSLDTRPVQTPAKRPLILPTEALAEAIAEEWRGQGAHVVPTSMPLTRMANAAIDKVAPAPMAVVEHLAAYGETDLLCHLAEGPEGLVERQRTGWGPVIAWAAETHAIRLHQTAGVMPLTQPAESLANLRGVLAGRDAFALTAAYDLVTLSGSALLALAVIDGFRSAEAAWGLSRLDEDWQIAEWGEDAEAAADAAARRAAFLRAHQVTTLL
ncbi:MAG: ATP12 family protein [Pseudomonadota bacterium]